MTLPDSRTWADRFIHGPFRAWAFLRLAGALLVPCAIPLTHAPLSAQEPPLEERASGDSEASLWPDSRTRTLTAMPVSGEITVDGHLNEEAWSQADPATGFVQEEPLDGEAAIEETEVRILYDEESVYIGARLLDSDPSRIARQLTRRDETGRAAGYLEFSFDTNLDRSTGYTFRVTAAGVQRDEYNYDDTRSDRSWDAVWESAVRTTDEGWVAEVRIPLSQIRYVPSAGPQSWGVAFARRRIADNERSAWAWVPQGVHGGVSRWGRLEGLVLPGGGRSVELLPYTMGGVERATGAVGDPFFQSTRTTSGLGTDLRADLGSHFVLDAAINPDFGQVEVDPQVINLSAFETFFPERRPFFTRDDSLFDFGLAGRRNNLFYSRRIGRTPQGRAPAGSDFTDAPDRTTILGTGKITGRTDGGLTLGALVAATAAEEGRAYLSETDDVVPYPAEPRTIYSAFRVQQEFREAQSRVGGIFTAVDRSLPGDGSFDFIPQRAFSAGLDFEHSWGDRAWGVEGSFAASHVRGSPEAILLLQQSSNHYFQRPDQDYLELDPTASSLSGHEWRLQFERRSGRHWTGAVWAGQRAPGFEVNDLGFSDSTERLDAGARIQYAEREPGDIFQDYRFSLFTFHNWRHSVTDDLLSSSAWSEAHKNGQLSLDANFTLRNWWGLGFEVEYEPEVLSDVLTRGGPLMVAPGSRGFSIDWSTDRRSSLTWGASVEYEKGTRGGGELSLGVEADFRPTSGIAVSLGPEYSRETDPVQFATSLEDASYEPTFGRRYMFAEIQQEQVSLDTRMDIILSPTLSVQVFAQPLLAAGDFIRYRQLAEPSSFHLLEFAEGEVAEADPGTGGTVRCMNGDLCRSGGRIHLDYTGDGVADASFADRSFTVRSLRTSAVLRWEYRPGSRLYLAWQQSRQGRLPFGTLELDRDAGALFSAPGEHFFMIKLDYWLDF